jgi:hypothetical protein
LDAGHACNCSGLTCDSNSPSCKYGQSKCDPGAEACCPSGTCKWDDHIWTSGRKGTCRIHIKQEHVSNEEAFTFTLRSYLDDGPQRSEKEVRVGYGDNYEWHNGPGPDRNRLAEGIIIEASRRRMKRSWPADDAVLEPLRQPRPDPGNSTVPGVPRLGEDGSYQNRDLIFTTTDEKFSTADRDESKKPFCRMGDWDTHGGWHL